MTTIDNNPPDTHSVDAERFPASDDPTNIGLGATQPIDITELMADWDVWPRASSLEPHDK